MDRLLLRAKGFLAPAAPAPPAGTPRPPSYTAAQEQSSTRPAIHRTRSTPDTEHQGSTAARQQDYPKDAAPAPAPAAGQPEQRRRTVTGGFRQSKRANARKAASRAALKDATRHPPKRHPLDNDNSKPTAPGNTPPAKTASAQPMRPGSTAARQRRTRPAAARQHGSTTTAHPGSTGRRQRQHQHQQKPKLHAPE